ncbi:hypothetical protein Pve01_39460 [Planomonospora venezuelensis]|nr:hypothetical protein Pve01_39460 [Planomonospora venezuelensis]
MIAGAGPVGLVLALLLARWRVPSTVLEAQPYRDATGSRAICFQRDVLDVLDRVGCAEQIVAEGVTWTTGRTYYREHELFAVTFPDPGRGVLPPWINISQARVEELLLAKAAHEPLVDLRFGHRVIGCRQDAGGIEADAATATGRVSVPGAHLVGADGARSAVRRLAGIGFPGRSFDDLFLICDVRADLPFPSERRFHFDPPWNPGRQVLVHQCPDSVWRIDWQVPPAFDPATADVDAMVRRITGDRPYEIVWRTLYRFHERVASAFRRDRIFLAGDAAHLYAPFGARGLNSGIQDAENLAWKLALGGDVLLDSYETERRAAALENLKVTGDTMAFLVPQDEARRERRRSVLTRAVSDPAARAQIDSGRLAEPYWYVDSPLTTGGGPVPAGPGAARPPLPGVLCPDGPVTAAGRATRLRRLFGSGFTVLTARADRVEAARTACAGGVPVTVHALADIDADGVVVRALHAGGDSVHLVRPDGHLAAVLPAFSGTALREALRRAAGDPRVPSSRSGRSGGPDGSLPIMNHVLATERLILRPVTVHDHGELLAHWAAPQVRRFLFDGVAPAPEQITAAIEGSVRDFARAGYGLWLIREADGSGLAGTAGLRPLDDLGLEVVYSLDPGAWGRGYATEAARAVVEYALDTLGLPEVLAEVDEGNAASAAVVTRLGMTPFATVPGLLGPMTRYRRTR